MNYLQQKIYTTFIMEDRYRFFLDGLNVTLELTFASFILGTVFGILFCAAIRSRNAAVRKAAKFISAIFIEIPTMVLLMIFVYIIFGRSSLPVLLVVISGLMLKSASYLSQIFNSALDTVSEGEIEAARTLGMTKWQAFHYVTLPQTVAASLPLYKNQFIASMQETSIVGYLAIVDLTRASSIVSSRTMDSLFGLLTVTVIYFIIGALVKLLFRLFSEKYVKGGAVS